MKDYDTFKQYMERLAKEYESAEEFDTFPVWLRNLPSPEKKEKNRWKPFYGDVYHIPCLQSSSLYATYEWDNVSLDHTFYERGIVCKTTYEAIALAERMLEAIKN